MSEEKPKKSGQSSLKSIASRGRQSYNIDPRIIRVEEGWNVRQPGPELDEHIQTLSDSIVENGMKQMLTIYMVDGQPTLIDGHCRLAAVLMAIENGHDIKTVACIAESNRINSADRVLSIITSNSGKQLTMLEQSIVVQRLFNFGWTKQQIADKTRLSITAIENLLILADAPQKAKNMIAANTIAPSLVVDTIRVNGIAAAEQTFSQAATEIESGAKSRITAKNLNTTKPEDDERNYAGVIKYKKHGPEIYSILKKIVMAEPGADRVAAIAEGQALINDADDGLLAR